MQMNLPVEQLEPQAMASHCSDKGEDYVHLSIAISLKRIADALERHGGDLQAIHRTLARTTAKRGVA
jgi:hypothetical protein